MKIPKEAKEMFKGEIFDVYQWPQKMYDGSVETFEMLKRVDTVQILAISTDGKIILAEEEQPVYDKKCGFFGGRVELNEEPLECAKRELLEEAGLISDEWELIRSYEPYNKMEWEIHWYVARECKKAANQQLDPGEKIEVVEKTWDEFMDILINDKKFSAKEIVLDILRYQCKGELDSLKSRLLK